MCRLTAITRTTFFAAICLILIHTDQQCMFFYVKWNLLNSKKSEVPPPRICVFSFQAAGISHACPTASLWGGWANPSPGVWLHAL